MAAAPRLALCRLEGPSLLSNSRNQCSALQNRSAKLQRLVHPTPQSNDITRFPSCLTTFLPTLCIYVEQEQQQVVPFVGGAKRRRMEESNQNLPKTPHRCALKFCPAGGGRGGGGAFFEQNWGRTTLFTVICGQNWSNATHVV